MMVLEFCENGNLRNYLDKSNQSGQYIDYESKIDTLLQIARGLLDIHKAGKVHKDLIHVTYYLAISVNLI